VENGLPELFSCLEHLLRRQKETVGKLYSLARGQIEVMREADTEALMTLVNDQLILANELAGLEEERYDTQAALAAASGLRPGATLHTLLTFAPENDRARLASLGAALKAELVSLRNVNDICLVMARRGLQFNTRLLAAMGVLGGSSYGPGGEIFPAATAQALDSVV
jgi:hypothetical protein